MRKNYNVTTQAEQWKRGFLAAPLTIRQKAALIASSPVLNDEDMFNPVPGQEVWLRREEDKKRKNEQALGI